MTTSGTFVSYGGIEGSDVTIREVPDAPGPSSTVRPGSRILSHGAIYVAGTVLQRGLAFLLLPVLLRVMSLEEHGLVGTSVALAALLR